MQYGGGSSNNNNKRKKKNDAKRDAKKKIQSWSGDKNASHLHSLSAVGPE